MEAIDRGVEAGKLCCMPLRGLFLAGMLASFVPALAQDSPLQPIPVTTCQLEAHPDAYDGKVVQVRGRIYYGKFDFVIDSDCKDHYQTRVWLDLGGDVESPGRYWGILNFLLKQKGQDVQVRGISVPLVHDDLLDLFVSDVGATRFRKPDGDNCGWECLFYEVTATLRGRFFSGTKGGFGLEDCCHLLVIEKVIQVSSKRNQVPAGGEFECSSDRWQFSAEELKELSAIPGCSLRDDFKMCSVEFARHWGDKINAREGLDYPGPWMSRDMMLSYKAAANFIQGPDGISRMKPSSSVTRVACRAAKPPYPASDHVHCDFLRSGLLQDRNAAIALQKTINAGRETWRLSDMVQVGWLAYQDWARQSELDATTPLRFAGCEQGTNAESSEPWAQCTWLAHDDMQEVIVDLNKPLYLKDSTGKFDKAPWVATEVQANRCRTERKLR